MTLRLTETGLSESAVDGGRLFTVKLKDEFYPVYVTRYVKTWNDCDAVETWYELRHDEQGAMWGQSPSLSISVTMVQIFRNCAVGGGHEVWFTYSLNIPIGEPVLLCNMDHLIARNSFR